MSERMTPDQLARVRLIVSTPRFDLSPADVMAIEAVLADYDQLTKAIDTACKLADTGSDEHKVMFDPYEAGEIPPGWRVAEAMREVLLEATR